jgi:hypothetical protein
VPAEHGIQEDEPGITLYVPKLQGMQNCWAALGANVPAVQLEHAVNPVVRAFIPMLQSVQKLVPSWS